MEKLDSISVLDSCEDCAPCLVTPHSLRLYALDTQYISSPGQCFTIKDQWDRKKKWTRGGSKCVKISFWTWEGRKMGARIGDAEDGGIEIMGLEDIIMAMRKGKDKAWKLDTCLLDLLNNNRFRRTQP
jgi:hypothetical protein